MITTYIEGEEVCYRKGNITFIRYFVSTKTVDFDFKICWNDCMYHFRYIIAIIFK